MANVLDKAHEANPTGDDALYLINNPGGTPGDRWTTIAEVAASAPLSSRYLSILAPSGDTSGATDVTNINAAIASGGIVFLGPGVFYLNARFDAPADVTVCGSGWATILRATAANTGTMLRLRGLTNITVRDLAFDGAGFAATGAMTDLPVGSDVAVAHHVERCHFTGFTGSACREVHAVTDYRFVDNTIEDTAKGFSMEAPTSSTSSFVTVSRNVVGNLTATGATGLQLYNIGSDAYYFVQVCDNHLDTVGATSIPIEMMGCNTAVASGNIIGAATSGISTARCTDTIISENVIRDQTNYAVEMETGTRMKLVDNIALDCTIFCFDGETATDLTIVGNTIVGTGLASGAGTARTIVIHAGTGLLIADNYFRGLEYADTIIYLGLTTAVINATVRDNDFYVDTTNAPLECVRVSQVTDCTIEGNKVKVSRNLVAGDDNSQAIRVNMGANVVGVSVLRNEVVFTGTIGASTTATGIGTQTAAAAAVARSRMVGNRVHNAPYGFGASTTSADFIFEDNDGRTCVVEHSINAAVIYRRTRRDYEGTAAPTAGTWVAGDRVWNTAPAGGGVPGWICTTGGTSGTWKAMAVLAA